MFIVLPGTLTLGTARCGRCVVGTCGVAWCGGYVWWVGVGVCALCLPVQVCPLWFSALLCVCCVSVVFKSADSNVAIRAYND